MPVKTIHKIENENVSPASRLQKNASVPNAENLSIHASTSGFAEGGKDSIFPFSAGTTSSY